MGIEEEGDEEDIKQSSRIYERETREARDMHTHTHTHTPVEMEYTSF